MLMAKSNLSDKSTVFITQGKSAYENTINTLSQVDLGFMSGKKILLKPNVGRIAYPGDGINTDPNVVAASIDFFLDNNSEVAVGESPISGVNVMDAFDASGIADITKQRKCKLIDLDKKGYKKCNTKNAKVMKFFKICKSVFDYDYIVSIPVMKTHMHTGVTLSVKNMKGCLWKKSKVDLHMLPPVPETNEKPINIAIADMAEILKPDLTLIDGIVGMEGLGPSVGNPKPLGVIIASLDSFAADAIACYLMGISPKEIPHLKLCNQREYGHISLDKIIVKPDNWKDYINPFNLPPDNLSIEFPKVSIFDKNSCSACQSSLLVFLKKYHNEIFKIFPNKEKFCFAIGKSNVDLPEDTICIGNCTLANSKNSLFIQGCPPVASAILEFIKKKL